MLETLKKLWKNRAKYVGSEDGFWQYAIPAGISLASAIFGKKDKDEIPQYKYEEPAEVGQARTQLYSKLFGTPTSYRTPEYTSARKSLYSQLFEQPVEAQRVSEAQRTRGLEDIETQARREAEGATFGVSRRGFRPEVGATSTYQTMLENIAGKEAKEKTYLSERIAEIETEYQRIAEQNRIAQQMGFMSAEQAEMANQQALEQAQTQQQLAFLTGETSGLQSLASQQYGGDVGTYQMQQASIPQIGETLGEILGSMGAEEEPEEDIYSKILKMLQGETTTPWSTQYPSVAPPNYYLSPAAR